MFLKFHLRFIFYYVCVKGEKNGKRKDYRCDEKI